MRQTTKWSEEEEQLLRERYHLDGAAILAPQMGRTVRSVQKKAFNMGLKAGRLTTSEEQQLHQLHATMRERERLKDPARHEQQKEALRRNNLNRRARFRAARTCIRCGQPSIEHNTSYCLLHWAATIAQTCGHYDLAFARVLLDKLEAQNYRCALTGDLLIPSLNASIDHIIPRAKGGSLDAPDNLWWVTTDVNFAKRQMVPDEFVEFCRKVVAFADEHQE
ncbi:MAG: HNH endonuclease [Roseiflexaceae bacterium]